MRTQWLEVYNYYPSPQAQYSFHNDFYFTPSEQIASALGKSNQMDDFELNVDLTLREEILSYLV